MRNYSRLDELSRCRADAPDPRARPIRSSKTGAKPPTVFAPADVDNFVKADEDGGGRAEALCGPPADVSEGSLRLVKPLSDRFVLLGYHRNDDDP